MALLISLICSLLALIIIASLQSSSSSSSLFSLSTLTPSSSTVSTPSSFSVCVALSPDDVSHDASISAILSVINSTAPHAPAACLHNWEGRFGNHVLQAAFLIAIAARHALSAAVPTFLFPPDLLILESYFTPVCPETSDPNHPIRRFTASGERDMGTWFDMNPLLLNEAGPLNPLDATYNTSYSAIYTAWPYRYHTSRYIPYRPLLTYLFRPKLAIQTVLLTLWHELLFLLPDDMLLIAVHIRHGDYNCQKGQCRYRPIPIDWYHRWIQSLLLAHNNNNNNNNSSNTTTITTSNTILSNALHRQQREEQQARLALQQQVTPGERVEQAAKLAHCITPAASTTTPTITASSPVRFCVLVLSDDLDGVYAQFAAHQYNTISVRDVVKLLPTSLSMTGSISEYYLDWWLLTRCALIATSHSTFSLTAAMFNQYVVEVEKREANSSFYRPDADTLALIDYDPWNYWYNDDAFLYKDLN